MSEGEFKDTAAKVKAFYSGSWPTDLRLKLYGLYKQATEGDATYATQPYRVQLERRAMWDAWNEERGRSKDDAKREYVLLGTKLLAALDNQEDLTSIHE